MCIFCDIIEGKVPSTKRYEDDKFIIIDDISHRAKKHYLIIPKAHYSTFAEQTEEQAIDLGLMLNRFSRFGKILGLEEGYRMMINQGENAGQSVEHVHVHILGGEKLPVAP